MLTPAREQLGEEKAGGLWHIVSSKRKKSSTTKLKKNRERPRTTSGLGSRLTGLVGGTKGGREQSPQ